MSKPLVEYTKKGLLAIINALPMAILVIDQDRSVLISNQNAKIFTNKKQLKGRASGEVFDCINHKKNANGYGFSRGCVDCKLKNAIETTLAQGRPKFMVETQKTLIGKGKRDLRFSTTPLKLGGKSAVLLSIEDLTEKKAHDRVWVEKEKLTTALETTGGIAHEFSQPIQVIMGYCEILLDQRGMDEKTATALASIQKEVDKLARLTHDLTNITRYETKPYLKSKIIDIKKSTGKESLPGQ
ncbi:MAG: hypothetical protein HUN05_05620 [Desulfobacter sp.]|nr:MAG: hypothetical protein HUN05_05620 [Desulfobacter sp.]